MSRLFGHADAGVLATSEAVAEEDPSAGAIHRAFEVVDLQLQFGLQIVRDRSEHALAAALLGDVDVTVLRRDRLLQNLQITAKQTQPPCF